MAKALRDAAGPRVKTSLLLCQRVRTTSDGLSLPWEDVAGGSGPIVQRPAESSDDSTSAEGSSSSDDVETVLERPAPRPPRPAPVAGAAEEKPPPWKSFWLMTAVGFGLIALAAMAINALWGG
jgi:hypothetical protein